MRVCVCACAGVCVCGCVCACADVCVCVCVLCARVWVIGEGNKVVERRHIHVCFVSRDKQI